MRPRAPSCVRVLAAVAAAAFAAGCVAVPGSVDRNLLRTITPDPFPGLDPGFKTQAGLHFEVRAYGSDRAAEVSALAERLYQRIMNDTGLFSFVPRGLYPVVVYASKEEFRQKTNLPAWSAGVSVGNAIYTYQGDHLSGVLAHEMAHLVFHEFMGRPRSDLRWVNEGLAVYEEEEASGPPSRPAFGPGREPLPFEQMTRLAPLSEGERAVSSWYAQVTSVVRFMIERGGRIGFSEFLRSLQRGALPDEAARAAFPGAWESMAALESAWRRGQ